MTPTITAAIRADAATSDAEGRAQAAEMVASLTIGALAETITRLNASEDRALRLEVQRDELLAQIDRVENMLSPAPSRTMSLADNVRADLAESDRLRNDAIAARDNMEHERDMAIANRDRFVGLGDIFRTERDAAISQGQLAAAEAATLRDRVREFEARPVLTVERLRDAMSEVATYPGVAEGVMAKLGTVTLPAQDRAEDVIAAYVDEFAATAEREGMSPPDKWADVPAKRRSWCAGVMSRALASLGAPAKTPSVPADVVSIDGLVAVYVTEERLADVLAALPVWRGERMPWQYGGARVWAADLLTRLSGVTPEPSVPADVFAGVTIEDLSVAYDDGWHRAARLPGGLRGDQGTAAGIAAVLDLLRVKLVAPVDPEAVARNYHEHGDSPVSHWSTLDVAAASAARAMRATLDAAGIPVTPEAGK